MSDLAVTETVQVQFQARRVSKNTTKLTRLIWYTMGTAHLSNDYRSRFEVGSSAAGIRYNAIQATSALMNERSMQPNRSVFEPPGTPLVWTRRCLSDEPGCTYGWVPGGSDEPGCTYGWVPGGSDEPGCTYGWVPGGSDEPSRALDGCTCK
jgi:hypothetical protein